MRKVFHYRNKCIGCFACVEIAGEQWRMSKKDGKSVLLNAVEKRGTWSVEVHDDEADLNRIAEKTCPVKAIKVAK